MVTWAIFHNPIIMPIFGLFIGWFTDWLALKMIFNPKHPTRYLGLVEWQGLFLQAAQGGRRPLRRLIAEEILTPSHMFEALLRGPAVRPAVPRWSSGTCSG